MIALTTSHVITIVALGVWIFGLATLVGICQFVGWIHDRTPDEGWDEWDEIDELERARWARKIEAQDRVPFDWSGGEAA